MSKKKKAIIITSLSILLVVAIIAAIFLIFKKENVKDLYFRIETKNFVKHMDALEKKRAEHEKKYKPYRESPSRSRYEISAKLASPGSAEDAFGDIPSQVLDIINSSKFVLNSRYDLKEEKSLTSLAFLLEGLNLADANIFAHKNTIGLQVPIIYDKYFLFDKNTTEAVLDKFNLDFPINNILFPGEIKSASNFSILECRDILVEYIDFFKTNISDDQIALVKNIQNYGFEHNKGGKYDQYTLSFTEKQFKDLYSAFIEMTFKDERLVNITAGNIINIFELFEKAGYFELFSDFKPFTEKILGYSVYSTLKKDLKNLLENVEFPDGLNMKIVADSSGNVITRDINVSSKQPDIPVRIYNISVEEKSITGKIEQPSEDGKNNASIEFTFNQADSSKLEGAIKCINNIWPDFEAKISTLSESSENVKKKLISTNNKLLVEFDVEEYGIKDANILIDIKREDRYDENFDMPLLDNDSAINLNTISDEQLKGVIKELQFAAAKFLLNNQDLIEPFIKTDEK
jgi:uncharacterized protein YxeA